MSPLDIEAVKSLAASQDPYLRVLAELALLRAKKEADYNRDGIKLSEYFPFGLQSYVQMLWVKVLRLRSLSVSLDDPGYESIDDSLRDLINYAVFTLMRHHE